MYFIIWESIMKANKSDFIIIIKQYSVSKLLISFRGKSNNKQTSQGHAFKSIIWPFEALTISDYQSDTEHNCSDTTEIVMFLRIFFQDYCRLMHCSQQPKKCNSFFPNCIF